MRIRHAAGGHRLDQCRERRQRLRGAHVIGRGPFREAAGVGEP
jgi:hypothetical protein